MSGARLVARTVRGIEHLVAAEIRELGLGRVDRLAHREVWFSCPEVGPAVLGLSCADDVFLVGATVDGVGRGRSDLRLLAEAAGAVAVRPEAGVRTLDVSASFLGRRNYNRYDVEDAVGEQLAAVAGLRYRGRRDGEVPPPGGMSWRVTIADDQAAIALRLASRPLHRRAYRRVTRPGSLHPPVAAAMVRLAGPGQRLLDPFCGSGTIPIEASMAGRDVVGSDVDLAAARANGPGLDWVLADAGRLPFRTGGIDLVVGNPPWERQVSAAGVLATRPELFWRELRRVLRPGG
ncbi:MAG: methyltransferase domain-containing protein, partial [Kibdelosporangium sp.]